MPRQEFTSEERERRKQTGIQLALERKDIETREAALSTLNKETASEADKLLREIARHSFYPVTKMDPDSAEQFKTALRTFGVNLLEDSLIMIHPLQTCLSIGECCSRINMYESDKVNLNYIHPQSPVGRIIARIAPKQGVVGEFVVINRNGGSRLIEAQLLFPNKIDRIYLTGKLAETILAARKEYIATNSTL